MCENQHRVKFERYFASKSIFEMDSEFTRVVLGAFRLRQGKAHSRSSPRVFMFAGNDRSIASFESYFNQLESVFDYHVERWFFS